MQFELKILGSSSALPTKNRNLSAQVLNINDKIMLIDCADGTQLHLKRFGIKFNRINYIFVSHLHGDHFFGLIGLISTSHLLGREKELNIFGPPELKEIINSQLKITGTDLLFPVVFNKLKEGESELILDRKDFTVKSFPMVHRIPAWGFVFREKYLPRNIKKSFAEKKQIPFDQFDKIKSGEDFVDENGKVYKNEEITNDPPRPRSYAFCSDTKYTESIIPYIEGVDLLYHEATFAENMKDEAHKKFHSTAREASEIARKANVKKLIIGHFSARYKDTGVLLEEARHVFPETYIAEDGRKFKVERINK